MSYKMFVNLPVKDLSTSKEFYQALGWTLNQQFTDETAASVVISDELYVMLLTHEKFAEFTDRKVASPDTFEVAIALGVDSKDEVDRIADAAIAAGGKEAGPPQDYGFMQMRSFTDPDAHHWEVLYMDPAHVQPAS